MIIELELGNHCIQTAAKRVYERLLSRYLKGDAETNESFALERQIEGLVFFLKYADFQDLRSSYHDLDGRRYHQVLLLMPEDFTQIKIKRDNQLVSPRWKAQETSEKI